MLIKLRLLCVLKVTCKFYWYVLKFACVQFQTNLISFLHYSNLFRGPFFRTQCRRSRYRVVRKVRTRDVLLNLTSMLLNGSQICPKSGIRFQCVCSICPSWAARTTLTKTHMTTKHAVLTADHSFHLCHIGIMLVQTSSSYCIVYRPATFSVTAC